MAALHVTTPILRACIGVPRHGSAREFAGHELTDPDRPDHHPPRVVRRVDADVLAELARVPA